MCRLQMLSDCRLEELSSTALHHYCGCGKRLAEPHSERPDGEREQMERHDISVYFLPGRSRASCCTKGTASRPVSQERAILLQR
jgi:hypothetical protein